MSFESPVIYYLDKAPNKKFSWVELGVLGALTVVCLYLLFGSSLFRRHCSSCVEGMTLTPNEQIPDTIGNTDVPKLSTEQQSFLLENVARTERTNPTPDPLTSLGHPWSRRDPGFLLDEGTMNGLIVHNTKCSKSCCGQQWPVPHDIKRDPTVCGKGGKYMPTNITCANEYTTGCACITKRLWDYLVAKGGNGTFPHQVYF
jgi:hypothetical protein